jgi:RND family efflux transporter MFP subunit
VFLPKLKWNLSAICCFGLLFGFVACSEPEQPPELPPRSIRWARVSGTVPAEQRVISGIVTAVDDTRLAFEVGGTVDTVEVRMGNAVQRGDVLARLDPEPFDLSVTDAEAELAHALAMQQAANSDFERTKILFEASVASRQELDRDTAARDSRNSHVKAAHARLELAKRDRRRSVLRSPFRGAISVRAIDPAMKVASGQTAFEMDSDESGLRVEVQMPETLITRVRQGDVVRVTFPSIESAERTNDNAVTEAVVTEVGTRASTGNAFPVRANLVEPPVGLRPGMTAEVSFELQSVEADALGLEGFLVPFAAVNAEANSTFVAYVFDRETSSLIRTPIETGGVRDNEVAVLSGLTEGDIIATAGVAFLRDGQEVTLLDEGLGLNPR